MSRISRLEKVLKTKSLYGYKITETCEDSYEQFYVQGKLETVRKVSDVIDYVDIYVENTSSDKKTMGQANFIVTHNLTSNEISSLIDKAVSQAKYINNDPYSLVSGKGKKSYSYKPNEETPTEILQKISKIFFSKTNEKLRFNSLECFYKEITSTLVNSNRVNLKKKVFNISIEAIPSYYNGEVKTELYRMFRYDNLDYAKIEKDAKQALEDVDKRGKAIKIENIGKCNVILRSQEIRDLFDEYISSFSYQSVYNHSNLRSAGDNLQTKPYEKLNLTLDRKSKADFFDGDGIILSKCKLIENGVLKQHFGDNRFAQYLNAKPTGYLPKLVLKPGKKTTDDLKKEPYIEIIDLSGIQVDSFAGYLGGEVRLALYYNGEKCTPITGFSFSTNLDYAINHMRFSKETEAIENYEGPKLVKIDKADIL